MADIDNVCKLERVCSIEEGVNTSNWDDTKCEGTLDFSALYGLPNNVIVYSSSHAKIYVGKSYWLDCNLSEFDPDSSNVMEIAKWIVDDIEKNKFAVEQLLPHVRQHIVVGKGIMDFINSHEGAKEKLAAWGIKGVKLAHNILNDNMDIISAILPDIDADFTSSNGKLYKNLPSLLWGYCGSSFTSEIIDERCYTMINNFLYKYSLSDFEEWLVVYDILKKHLFYVGHFKLYDNAIEIVEDIGWPDIILDSLSPIRDEKGLIKFSNVEELQTMLDLIAHE